MGRKEKNPVVEAPIAEAPIAEAPIAEAPIAEAPAVVVEDSAPSGDMPLISKLERAITSVLLNQMGNNAMMHNLRAKLMDALKSVK